VIIGVLPAGVYRHYKGRLYLVLGLAHDANADELYVDPYDDAPEPLGERRVVVYIGLQLDAAHEGPRLAVRTLEDFHQIVCTNPEHAHYGDRVPTNFVISAGSECYLERRFVYLSDTYVPGMEKKWTS
jgi:hypothetical protein